MVVLPSTRRHAFSLVELAVTFALVALLAAVLFPIIVRARENAKTDCVSNLKRIGIAWRQYAQDYDGHLMRFSTAPDDALLPSPKNKVTYWWGSWDKVTLKPGEGLLYPYAKTASIYACPAFAPARGGSQGNLGYGYNAGNLSPTRYQEEETIAVPVAIAFSDIGQPARTVAFADAAQFAFKNSDELRASSYLSSPRAEYPNFHGRHNGQGNVLFCDGHVAALTPIYRTGTFGFSYSAERFKRQHLGDLDEDGDLKTGELFTLNKNKAK